MGLPKVAVVTPYWKEPPEVLQRAIASVRAQTLGAIHYVVADGNPADIPPDPSIVHLVLPGNVGNSGATPRGLGAQLAFNDGCDAVAFLDADNWFEPDHLARAVALLEEKRLDVAFARRHIVFPDGERLGVPDAQDEAGHVDTNCYVFSRRAAFLVNLWSMWPCEFGAGEDRIMRAVIHRLGLKVETLDRPTVWYESNWGLHYRLAGKTPCAPLRRPARRIPDHFDPERFFRQTGIRFPMPRGERAQPLAETPLERWRIVVVTPWLAGLDGAALGRSARSVAAQDVDAAHFVVGSERYPVPDVGERVERWNLPGARADHGNTARGFGAVMAFQRGADAVVFLEPGEVWAPGYLRALARAAAEERTSDQALDRAEGRSKGRADLVVASASAGALTPVDSAAAILIPRRAAYLAAAWAQLPPMSSVGASARFLVQSARIRGASVFAVAALTASPASSLGSVRAEPDPPLPDPDVLRARMGLRAVSAATGPRAGAHPAADPLRSLGIIVGAMKCATTALFDALSRHPQVLGSVRKETDFFCREDALSDAALEDYRLFWGNWNPTRHRVALEASTSYTKSPHVAGVPVRIAAVRADAPLIYLVRDPVERIRSHYVMAHAKRALEGSSAAPLGPIEAGIDPHVLDITRYASQLAQYRAVFPERCLLVLSLDAFADAPGPAMARVQAHLGLQPRADLRLDVAHDSLRHYLPPLVAAQLLREGAIGTARDAAGVRAHLNALSPADRTALLRRALVAVTPSEATRAWIRRELRDDMRELQATYGIDVGRWGFATGARG